MSTVTFTFDAWLAWWAKPVLTFAVFFGSSRLVRFVKDHGVRVRLDQLPAQCCELDEQTGHELVSVSRDEASAKSAR